jgi:hypothetical protein
MKTEEFYSELGAQFPQIPWMAMDRALFIAARALCQIALAWRVDLPAVILVPTVSEYPLHPPFDARIVQILTLGDLVPATPSQLSARDPSWRERTGRPSWYFQTPDDKVLIAPQPGEGSEYCVVPHVALAPTAQADELDDAYALPHERLLLFGATASLGKANWFEFEAECRIARSYSSDGHRIGTPRKVRYGGL